MPDGTPKVASLIEVERGPGNYSLRIDGEEFPWYLTDEGVSTAVGRNGSPAITVTILADEVRLLDRLNLRTVYVIAPSRDLFDNFVSRHLQSRADKAVRIDRIGTTPSGLTPTDTVVLLPGRLTEQSKQLRQALEKKGIPILSATEFVASSPASADHSRTPGG